MKVNAEQMEIVAWIYEGGIAGAGVTKEAHELAEAAGLLFDKGGQTPSVARWVDFIYGLQPQLAAARGYNVHTRIEYKLCKDRCALSKL